MTTLTETSVTDSRLFEVKPERTLADLLVEIDYVVNHGQAVPCLVCGAMTAGGELGTPAECRDCGSTLE